MGRSDEGAQERTAVPPRRTIVLSEMTKFYIHFRLFNYSMGLRGEAVIKKHRDAVRRCIAADKTGYDLLSCIVDSMQEKYGKITAEEFGARQPGV